MPAELDTLHAMIKQAASERGLIVFDGELDVTKLASVAWSGEWLPFLDLAQQAQVRLLYLSSQHYDPDRIIVEEASDPDIIPEEPINDETTALTSRSEDESQAWLLARIRERIAPWEIRRGEVISVSCVWIKDHVAHHWRRYADWIFECREAIDTVLDEAELIERENRIVRSLEAARKLQEYAEQMAQHPRFPEATSEEKREFMASRLFPDTIDDDLLEPRAAASIAKRAVLIYWWDIEPVEKISKVERAKALHAQGESIRNIAAVLKMSEAKVKAALSETV